MGKTYVQKVGKLLRCSKAKRKEIEKQLMAEIQSEMEQKEDFSGLVKRMGTPKELAEEFNHSFSEEEKKKYKREKRIRNMGILAVILLLLAGGIYWYMPKTIAIEKSKVFQKETIQEKAKDVIQMLDDGRYEEVKAWSDGAMQKVLTEDMIKEAREAIGPDWGDFQSFGNAYMVQYMRMGKTMAVIEMNVSYENASVTYTISFNKDMTIAGLWMK